MTWKVMRIATWNLERPRMQQLTKIEALRAQMLSVDADIWILTETNACVSPGNGYDHRASLEITGPEKYWPGENRTTIWSRYPILKSIPTHDPETAVCVEVDLGNVLALIYGTILAYHAAGTKFRYRFEGASVSGHRNWELHYKSIANHAAEWHRLRQEFSNHNLIVAGDLNQTRDGGWYWTKEGRERLGTALGLAELVCATQGQIASIGEGTQLDPVIDHICLNQILADRVTAVRGWLPGKPERGKPYSDHTGVFVDVALP